MSSLLQSSTIKRLLGPNGFGRTLLAAGAFLIASLLGVTMPSAAAAHSLSFDAVNTVVFNTRVADEWDCLPVTSHRVDCERDTDVEESSGGRVPTSGGGDEGPSCRDLVAFFLVGATLDWRFYKSGCATGFAYHPRWSTALKPVPWTLLYDGWAAGVTSQGRPISIYLFRQFSDSGKFAFGSVDDAWVTVSLSCADGRTRQRTYHPHWDRNFGHSRAIRATEEEANGARLTLNGRIEGHARTGIRGTLRVSQTLRRGVRCRSGGVRFAAAAPRLTLFAP